MEKGDDMFDGFIFNSPFLDFGHTSSVVEIIIEKVTPLMTRLPIWGWSFEKEVDTPAPLKTDPIIFRGDSIAVSDWHAKLWSQYYYDFDCRTIYHSPNTVGFLKGVVAVQNKILQYKNKDEYILHNIHKPILNLSSRNDDTIESEESLVRIDAVGVNRTEIELPHNAHDAFLSSDADDVDLAFRMVANWMSSNGFA